MLKSNAFTTLLIRLQWLQTQGLIPILLSYLSPEFPSSAQTSAGDFLKAIITISANASQNEQSCIGPNSLTRQLVSESCMETLITSMLRGGNPLTVGVGIVIEVIRKNNSDYDPDVGGGADSPPSSHDPIYLGTLLRMFAKHVPDFMDLILSSKHTVTDGSGTKLVERGQLKSAWGIKIEPLGFDRFKTCELMAELLHCSNMGLLNERGSEEYVRQRDLERDRLRAEGTLNAHRESDSGIQYTEDSAGFTNGVSSPLAGSPEEIRRFEIANAGDEDGFEDVAASGVLNDEIKDNFDEKSAEKDKSSNEAFTAIQDRPRIDLSDEFMDEPLSSPRLAAETGKSSDEEALSPLQPLSTDPTSPTTAGLTERVRRFSLEKDTPMTTSECSLEETKPSDEASEQKDKLVIDTGSPGEISPHAEDTPAPLFAAPSAPPREEAISPKTVGGERSGISIDTTLGEGGDSSQSAIMSGNEQLFEPHIETDIDGMPVVGDYLKVMFVENRVVPTILVRKQGSHFSEQ
jgi:SIT4-associating protein SAP185/190